MNTETTKKQQFWLAHLEAADNSNLSIAQYAKEHNLVAQRLYQWRNVLKSKTTNITTEAKFTRVVTSAPLARNGLTLKHADTHLEFTCLPDPTWLSDLLNNIAVQR